MEYPIEYPIEIEPYILPLLSQHIQQSSTDESSQQQLAEFFEQKLNLSGNIDTQPVQPVPRQLPDIETLRNGSTSQLYHPSSPQLHHPSIPRLYNPSNHAPSSSVENATELHPLQPHRDNYLVRLLIQNDIKPSSLDRAQTTLFEQSSPDDRQKLLMLWRLAPPVLNGSLEENAWDRYAVSQPTSLELEEELAMRRYQLNRAQPSGDRHTAAQQQPEPSTETSHFFDPRSTVDGYQQRVEVPRDGDIDDVMMM